ncbi:MAG: hypothetical protein QNJ51_04260 [Calothrix sp. MO_167.B12]|nr:hypothetical protein [Calothrix sp. MO_167.B12]
MFLRRGLNRAINTTQNFIHPTDCFQLNPDEDEVGGASQLDLYARVATNKPSSRIHSRYKRQVADIGA